MPCDVIRKMHVMNKRPVIRQVRDTASPFPQQDSLSARCMISLSNPHQSVPAFYATSLHLVVKCVPIKLRGFTNIPLQ